MASAPYDTLIVAINAANTRLNGDVNTLLPTGGQILKFSNAYSQQLVNTAWQKLQQFLVSRGYVRLKISGAIIPNVPPVSSPDPSLQVTLSWSGYSDGATAFPAVALPQDLIRPLKLAERPSGLDPSVPNLTSFIDIDFNIETIPSIPKQPWNQIAVWNDDQILMPGALVATDIRVDYAAYLADFLDTGNTTGTGYTRWFQQTIPILRASEPLTSYICAEAQRALGNPDAAEGYTQEGMAGAMEAIIGKPGE